MKKALVVSSGAGGAMVAKELQGRFDIRILEASKEFRPFSFNLGRLMVKKKITPIFLDLLVLFIIKIKYNYLHLIII